MRLLFPFIFAAVISQPAAGTPVPADVQIFLRSYTSLNGDVDTIVPVADMANTLAYRQSIGAKSSSISSVNLLNSNNLPQTYASSRTEFGNAKADAYLFYKVEVHGDPLSWVPVSFTGVFKVLSSIDSEPTDGFAVSTATASMGVTQHLESGAVSIGFTASLRNLDIANSARDTSQYDLLAAYSATEAVPFSNYIHGSSNFSEISGSWSLSGLDSSRDFHEASIYNAYTTMSGQVDGIYWAHINSEGLGVLDVDMGSEVHLSTFDGTPAGQSFVDPAFFVEPTFLAQHAGTFIRVLGGVGNGSTQSTTVPEPSALSMTIGCLVLSVLGVQAAGNRRRSGA